MSLESEMSGVCDKEMRKIRLQSPFLANVDIGTDLCSVDHTVLFDEDVVSDLSNAQHPASLTATE
ncbi:hypothetical protein INR49_028963 [Caranx melampygus]|nr:hypothetical protein INR49_028963 [Caranx melampygus]